MTLEKMATEVWFGSTVQLKNYLKMSNLFHDQLPAVSLFSQFGGRRVTDFARHLFGVVFAVLMGHRDTVLARGLHRDLPRLLVAVGDLDVVADGFFDRPQDIHAVGLWHFVAFSHRSVLGGLDGDLAAHLVGDDTAPAAVSVSGLGVGLSFGLSAPSTVVTTVMWAMMCVGSVAVVPVVMRRGMVDLGADLLVNGLALLGIGVFVSCLDFGLAGLFVGGVALFVGNLFNHRVTFGFGHRIAHLLIIGTIRDFDFRPTLLPLVGKIELLIFLPIFYLLVEVPVLYFTMGLRYNL